MDIEDIHKLYLNRQSCRKYSNKIVENEKLNKIIELTRLAPSACNSQPWSFIVVNNTTLSPKVAKCVQDMGMNGFTNQVSSFIVIVEEKASLSEKVGSKFKNQDFVSNDIGIATAYLTLAASSLGLSTCILGWINDKKLKETLNIDANKKTRLVVCVGYADNSDIIREKNRKPLEKISKFYY